MCRQIHFQRVLFTYNIYYIYMLSSYFIITLSQKYLFSTWNLWFSINMREIVLTRGLPRCSNILGQPKLVMDLLTRLPLMTRRRHRQTHFSASAVFFFSLSEPHSIQETVPCLSLSAYQADYSSTWSDVSTLFRLPWSPGSLVTQTENMRFDLHSSWWFSYTSIG